jgi:hypothetical protein
MLTMFREALGPDGQPGPISMRRVLAAVFAMAAVALFALALRLPAAGWTPYLPGALCLGACLLLLFFTTWSDVVALVQAARGKAS